MGGGSDSPFGAPLLGIYGVCHRQVFWSSSYHPRMSSLTRSGARSLTGSRRYRKTPSRDTLHGSHIGVSKLMAAMIDPEGNDHSHRESSVCLVGCQLFMRDGCIGVIYLSLDAMVSHILLKKQVNGRRSSIPLMNTHAALLPGKSVRHQIG